MDSEMTKKKKKKKKVNEIRLMNYYHMLSKINLGFDHLSYLN